MQDLALKVNENPIVESNPINEGFMMLSDSTKKIRPKPLPCNSSSPTCKTIIRIQRITTRTTTMKSLTALIDHSIGHLGRRLLNEPSYDTESETMLTDDEIKQLSKQLFNFEMTVDGSGFTTEDTTEQTTQTTTTTTSSSTTTIFTFTEPMLLNETKFIVELDCTNINNTISKILQEVNTTLNNPQVSHSDVQNDTANRCTVLFTFNTDNDTSTITDLIKKFSKIIDENNGSTAIDNLCNNNETIHVDEEVTACYVIDKCFLCGRNPVRGVCLKDKNESSCRCLPNEINPSKPYTGPLCREDSNTPLESSSIPARWTPIVVGILAGITGLFSAITLSLWLFSLSRPQPPLKPGNLTTPRLWHLPRAQIPTDVTSENVNNRPNSTTPSSRTTPTMDSSFFNDLDNDLQSSPTDYDPINELDSIIDNEDVEPTFDDPLNELDEQDDDLNGFINPNLQIPRANIDSNSAGLFPFANNIF